MEALQFQYHYVPILEFQILWAARATLYSFPLCGMIKIKIFTFVFKYRPLDRCSESAFESRQCLVRLELAFQNSKIFTNMIKQHCCVSSSLQLTVQFKQICNRRESCEPYKGSLFCSANQNGIRHRSSRLCSLHVWHLQSRLMLRA